MKLYMWKMFGGLENVENSFALQEPTYKYDIFQAADAFVFIGKRFIFRAKVKNFRIAVDMVFFEVESFCVLSNGKYTVRSAKRS